MGRKEKMRALFAPHIHTDLPPQLVKELQTKIGRIENQVLNVIKVGGGTLNIDEILVGLYKCNGLIKTRQYITTVVYRMQKHELIKSTGRKGEYKLV